MSVMYVATLDILTQKGHFDPEAARAIGEAIDLEIARSRGASATREDVNECRRALSDEIAAHKIETNKAFSELRSEFRLIRAEVKEEISAFRAAVNSEISTFRAEVNNEISTLRAEMKEAISGLRVEMHTLKADLVRWVFVVIMGQTAMLLGVLYFFMKYFK